MLTTNSIAALGALIGDPARTSMLVALMNGRALTATELAGVAGVTCYDHLAGSVAVGIADAMATRSNIIFSADGGELTASGMSFLDELGVAV